MKSYEINNNFEIAIFDLNAKLDNFKHVNVKVDKDTINYLNDFKRHIEIINFDISKTVKSLPKEIKIKSKTQKFLIIYFLVSVLILGGSVYLGSYYHSNYKTVSNSSYKEGFLKGSSFMRELIIERAPKSSAEWIKKNTKKLSTKKINEFSIKELNELAE